MKIGEIWQDNGKICPKCDFDTTLIRITGFGYGHYSHHLQQVHWCTGQNKTLFAGEGIGDLVRYEYVNNEIAGEHTMAREAFIILWRPYKKVLV